MEKYFNKFEIKSRVLNCIVPSILIFLSNHYYIIISLTNSSSST